MAAGLGEQLHVAVGTDGNDGEVGGCLTGALEVEIGCCGLGRSGRPRRHEAGPKGFGAGNVDDHRANVSERYALLARDGNVQLTPGVGRRRVGLAGVEQPARSDRGESAQPGRDTPQLQRRLHHSRARARDLEYAGEVVRRERAGHGCASLRLPRSGIGAACAGDRTDVHQPTDTGVTEEHHSAQRTTVLAKVGAHGHENSILLCLAAPDASGGERGTNRAHRVIISVSPIAGSNVAGSNEGASEPTVWTAPRRRLAAALPSASAEAIRPSGRTNTAAGVP